MKFNTFNAFKKAITSCNEVQDLCNKAKIDCFTYDIDEVEYSIILNSQDMTLKEFWDTIHNKEAEAKLQLEKIKEQKEAKRLKSQAFLLQNKQEFIKDNYKTLKLVNIQPDFDYYFNNKTMEEEEYICGISFEYSVEKNHHKETFAIEAEEDLLTSENIAIIREWINDKFSTKILNLAREVADNYIKNL